MTDLSEAKRLMVTDYKRKVGELKEKIKTYQIMINELESEVGVSPSQNIDVTVGQIIEPNVKLTVNSSSNATSFVRSLQFFGKTQPNATVALLQLAGHPLKTEEIIAGIEYAGVPVGGKDMKAKKNNFYPVLYRANNIIKIPNAPGAWGLPTWAKQKKSKTQKMLDLVNETKSRTQNDGENQEN